MSTYEDWFLEVVSYYRKLGFFMTGQFAGLAEHECMESIERSSHGWFRYAFPRANARENRSLFWLEVCLISADRAKVLTVDREGVYMMTRFYEAALHELAKISQGGFRPESVSEDWEDIGEEKDMIHVRYEVARLAQVTQ